MTNNPFWIQTHTPGTSFDLSAPKAEDVRIEDIAHALSHLCRFTGHCNRFYSVAQHSIHVAELVYATKPEWALAALLHDAEEAYLGDMSSPLKALFRTTENARVRLNAITLGVQNAIEKRFGLDMVGLDEYRARHACIKEADLKMLATERRDLMPTPPEGDWFASTGVAGVEPWLLRLPWYHHTTLSSRFLVSFCKYGGKP